MRAAADNHLSRALRVTRGAVYRPPGLVLPRHRQRERDGSVTEEAKVDRRWGGCNRDGWYVDGHQ